MVGCFTYYLHTSVIVAVFFQINAAFPPPWIKVFFYYTVLVSGEVLPIRGAQERYLVFPGFWVGIQDSFVFLVLRTPILNLALLLLTRPSRRFTLAYTASVAKLRIEARGENLTLTPTPFHQVKEGVAWRCLKALCPFGVGFSWHSNCGDSLLSYLPRTCLQSLTWGHAG